MSTSCLRMNAEMDAGTKKKAFQINLEGGILEALGRTFKSGLKLYVYPMIDEKTSSSKNSPIMIRSILRIYPPDALAKLESGDSAWEPMIPPEVTKFIKARQFFGYRAFAAT